MSIKRRIQFGAATLALAATLIMPLGVSATSSESDFSSYTIERLEALITKLQQQLLEMKQGAKCFVSNQELSLGDGEGDDLSADVRRLQEFLREKGLLKVKSTGYFGKLTRAALIAFQNQQSVSATGIFDAATRVKAHAMYCSSALRAKVTKEEKKEVKEERKEEKKSPSPNENAVKDITLSASGEYVNWTVNGYAARGFKVVWSKTPAPTYPLRDGDRYVYFSEPSAKQAKLEAFAGAGTYYVRVCQYLGGACGTYSNEVTMQW